MQPKILQIVPCTTVLHVRRTTDDGVPTAPLHVQVWALVEDPASKERRVIPLIAGDTPEQLAMADDDLTWVEGEGDAVSISGH